MANSKYIVMNNNVLQFWLRQIRDVLIAFGISVFVTYFYMGDQLFSSFGNLITHSLYGFVVGLSIWKVSTIVGVLINRKFPWDQNPGRVFRINIIAAIVSAAFVIIVVNWIYYEFVYKTSFSFTERHILIEMVVEMGITLIITTSFYSTRFFQFWKQAVINEEKYKREAVLLQYETLKSYVNPHFLFNSLSVLSALIDTDKERSQEFIRQLSGIFRYVLEQKDKELVPLEAEMEFAQNFIALYKVRHGNHLQVDVQIQDYSGYLVPLSMQIILENAFKHNIISESAPLFVLISRDSEQMIVSNPIRKKPDSVSNGFGLQALQKQYAWFTDRPVCIENDGTRFSVKVPIIQMKEI